MPPALDKAIRQKLDKPSGKLTKIFHDQNGGLSPSPDAWDNFRREE
jgi:hypothetical protein